MQVKYLGFSIEISGDNINLEKHMDNLIGLRNTPFVINEHNRHIFVDKNSSDAWYTGLLLTIKDQKRYCELLDADGKLTVRVNDLSKNSRLMDFNFFVINKKTGFGIYQYYHQSCNLNTFGYFNKLRFSDLRDSLIKNELEAMPNGSVTKKIEKSVRQRYKSELSLEIIVRKENLLQLLSELDHLNSFEYSVLSLDIKEPEFEPLKNYVRKEKTKISFVKKSPLENIAKSIADFVTRKDISNGRIIGTEADGTTRILNLMNTPDTFGEHTYDEIALKLNTLDMSEFEKSWVIADILKKCEEHKHIFEAKAQ